MIDPLLAKITIVTYGGGEILQKMFQAISMLFNGGKGGLIQPVMVICASLGGVYAFSKAFFGSVGQSLLLGYFFPLIAITSLLTIPSTTVHIEDILKTNRIEGVNQTSFYSVDHVPWLLAKFSETVSTIGYRLADGIESVMHLPNDPSYNSTGMIFGSESALDMTKYRLSNANLEQNFKQFAKQCVIYDIALNRYTLDDIKKSTDLWDFFERKTSNVRMIRYCPPNASLDQCSYVTCKAAIEKMRPFFEKEKELYAKTEIGRHLPLTFQALTGMQKESKELIGQQLTMNALTEELSGGKFAKQRAYLQQQSTYRTLGSLASSGLVTMRIVFEALIYAVFIFVIPLSLTPSGTKYLINWAWLVIWIQMWPPLYSILNYIMQIAAHYKFNGFLSGLTESERGLSVLTSIGMQNLNDEVFALASFLSLSVPYISYILLKEGLSSFVQLASSLMAPAQGAASSAAAEQISGNYSFANANFGQMAYNNATGMQTNFAPSISSGYFADNQGEISTVYGGNSPIVRQNTSELRTAVFSDDVIGKNLQKQVQEAESNMESVQQTISNNLSNSTRIMSDYISHLADSTNYSQGYSEREAQGIQESINYIQNIAEDFGKQYGLNTREATDALLGGAFSSGLNVKFGSFGVKAGGNYNLSASRDEIMNSALKLSKSEAFQSNLQKIQDFAKSEALNSSRDEGNRESQGVCHSIDALVSTQNAYQEAQNKLVQASANQAWFEQNSQSVKHSLNQDFVKWASEELCASGGFDHLKEILSQDQSTANQSLIKEFVNHVRVESDLPTSVKKDVYKNKPEFLSSFYKRKDEITSGHDEAITQSKEILDQNLKEDFCNHQSLDSIAQRFEKKSSEYMDSRFDVTAKYQDENEDFKDKFSKTNSRYLIGRMLSRPDQNSELVPKNQSTERPFWLMEGD